MSFVCFLKAFFSALVNLLAQYFTALEVAILDSKFTEETSDQKFAGSALIRFSADQLLSRIFSRPNRPNLKTDRSDGGSLWRTVAFMQCKARLSSIRNHISPEKVSECNEFL